jgi:hypothetical protein
VTARTNNDKEQKQIPPLRYGMTNWTALRNDKQRTQRQEQKQIRRFWLRQNDDERARIPPIAWDKGAMDGAPDLTPP